MTMSDIIIPATILSDCPMSEQSDPFATDIVADSFPSTENEASEEGDTFDHLELSPNKKYALWRRDMVDYWNPWWRQVLDSSKTNDKFGYFVWTKAKRSEVWVHFEQCADIHDGSPKAICKACWKVYAHPELRSGGSSTTTMRRHYEHKKCGGSTGQGVLSQFGVSR
jgi:hypothetical protein